MADTKLTDFTEAVIGDFPGDLYGVFGGADKKVPTELFASWRTIHNATPTAVSQIVIDITGYSILRWKMTGCRHNSGSNASIGPYASVDGGATYNVGVGSFTSVANTVDIFGSGFIVRYGSFLKGTGNSSGAASYGATSFTGAFDPAVYTSIAFKPSAGSFQAVGNITVEGLI